MYVVLSAVVLFLLWFACKYHRVLLAAYRLPEMPGYPAYPVIGHMHFIRHGYIGMVNIITRNLKEMSRIVKSTTVVWWTGVTPLFMLFDPDDIQTVLTSSSTHDKGPEIDFIKYAIGNGILAAKWKYWKVLRHHMNPLFHPRNLNQLMPVINECGRDLALNLSRHVGTGHVDVQHYVNDSAIASTCNLLFGAAFKVNVGSRPFRKMNEGLERFIKFWLWPEFMFKILYRNRIQDMEKSFIEYFQEPISEFESRRELQSIEISKDDKGPRFPKTGTDETQLTLVDVYLQLQQTINPHLIKTTDFRKEIVSLLTTASETTKVIVSSCFLALALHPEIQERLYAEVASVMDNTDEDVSMERLQNMPYLDQVFKETLRRFMVTPGVTRTVQQDVKLNCFTLPAGSTVGVSISGVHHDPRYYPDPDRFDPDNFLPERVAARPKYAFVPFSGGPRGCIGKHYAVMMVKTFIVHVLMKYKLSSDEDIDSLSNVPSLAFSFLKGYRVELQHR